MSDTSDKALLDICERIIAVYAAKGDIRPLQLKLKALLEEKEAKEHGKPQG